jgi:MtrB/PioB family decaheme-associated outer membrane protein
MRISRVVAIAALLLVPATLSAQQAAKPAAPESNTQSFNVGWVDFGGRWTTTDGDADRYSRYRDMSDGLFLDKARLDARSEAGWRFKIGADNLARKDQRYFADANRQGKARAWFVWDQIPMLMSTTTRTFYEGDVLDNAGFLQMADAIQAAGQISASNIPLLFTPENTQVFELSSKRHIAEFGGKFAPVQALSIKAVFRDTDRTGGIPYGGAFGHSQVIETVAPINHETRDFDANAEWAQGNYLFRFGYTGSWFTNNVATLQFDNPWRLTDSTSASSRGRLSLPPSNSMVGVNGLASVKLPGRSRLNAYISTSLLQDSVASSLMPNTINTATTGLLPLPRTTVEGEAKTLAYNVNFVSRPGKNFDFTARFQGHDYDNRTPEFDMVQRIAYDNSPSTLATPIPTEAFSLNRHLFDVEGRWLPAAGTSLGVGFSRLDEERNHRVYETIVDDVVRVTFDTLTNRWFSVRAKYEHGVRSGEDFEDVLTPVGEQPSMRHFDVASRDRDRFTLIGFITPINNLILNVSVAAGNDAYTESGMGLGDNNHRVYAIGFDTTPKDNITFGMSYSNENYTSLSRSRQASPNTPAGCVNTYPAPTGSTTCQFYDPTRNWQSDVDDNADSFILNASFLKLWQKVDINVSWDINQSKAFYGYVTDPTNDPTLPEGTPPLTSTLPTPTQLPDVKSNLNRGEVDLMYNFTPRIGFGFSYWYENYDVEDWALDAESTGSGVTNNAVLLGYMYKPYTAQTGWVRMVVRW